MKEQLISFETAKLAKEQGFRFVTNMVYNQRGQPMPCHSVQLWFESIKPPIDAPTQSLLQKWLREKHEIDVLPFKDEDTIQDLSLIYTWTIFNKGSISTIPKGYDTYEAALEKGLQEALKLI